MTEQTKISCPICKRAYLRLEEAKDLGRINTYDCDCCGRYIITNLALSSTVNLQPNYKLSAWIRDRNEKGADIPEITTDTFNEITSSLPDYSPSEKQLILLRNIEQKTKYPGYEVKINPKFDVPLAWASGPEEFNYYLQSLIDRGLLKMNAMSQCMITPNGWDYLEERATRLEDRTQVFVAMSFSEGLKSIWENALKQAITDAGYKPYRVDVEPHIDRIDAKIITEIKNSRFLVADVTEQKRGVYFEAGYALGLGLPVIWCVRNDDLTNVHFDTRQYNHIVWESEEQLKEQLYNVIIAIVGKSRTS